MPCSCVLIVSQCWCYRCDLETGNASRVVRLFGNVRELFGLEMWGSCSVWKCERVVRFGNVRELFGLEMWGGCSVWKCEGVVRFRNVRGLFGLEMWGSCSVWKCERVVRFGNVRELFGLEMCGGCSVWKCEGVVRFGNVWGLFGLEMWGGCLVGWESGFGFDDFCLLVIFHRPREFQTAIGVRPDVLWSFLIFHGLVIVKQECLKWSNSIHEKWVCILYWLETRRFRVVHGSRNPPAQMHVRLSDTYASRINNSNKIQNLLSTDLTLSQWATL